tara:strand:+ start:252 stop:509 length:258 start_codon:yes stop_codon:yes gene_type:complete
MIIINVKYMSATNTLGSRLKATMKGSDSLLSATVPFNYESFDSGVKEAAFKVLDAYTDIINENWAINVIGEDHKGETIVTAHVIQ